MTHLRNKHETLKHTIDVYNGVQIDSEALGVDEFKFGKALEGSLQKWQADGRKGVWLTIPINKSHFIPIAVELGFEFHFTAPKYIVLTKWLPKTSCTLPHGPGHIIGVGGFVVNEKNEILVVKEKQGIATSIWKIPGGMVDPGEDLHQAAIRETFEETGIKTEFISLLGARLRHGTRFGMTDIYFTCFLKPLTSEIVVQESEIAAAKWMPLEEFMKLPYYPPLYKKLMELGNQAAKKITKDFLWKSFQWILKIPFTTVLQNCNIKNAFPKQSLVNKIS